MSLLPFDERDGTIWFDGKLVPWREAKLHVLSHGLHYGSCVFEGERAYGGKIFKSAEHTARLAKSAELLGFTLPYSAEQIEAAKQAVLSANQIVDGYFRPVAWRGSEMMAISAQAARIHVAIAAWQWPSMYKKDIKERGIRLAQARYQRPSPATAPTASKAAGLYMICTISKHEAEREGFDDALMLDYRGYLAEATGANLFLVQNGALHTPTPDCFLDGITRRTVMDLARQAGLSVVERHLPPQELDQAQEIFLTGTAAEITPVSAIADRRYEVGPVTRQLMAAYHQAVHA